MLQEPSLDFKLVQRVCLLQQALDQALESLDELKQRVEHHQMLESHLAQTEEYSNVQQKIITNLKQQLEEKSERQNRVLQQLLFEVQSMTEQQQLELERLRIRIQQSQAEVQDYLVRLKNHYQATPSQFPLDPDLDLASEVMIVRALTVSVSSQLQAAHQHIRELDTTLTRHQVHLAQMQAYLDPSEATALPEAVPSLEPQNHQVLEDPVALVAIIRTQQQKLDDLSSELSSQFQQQARLKYRCQELAAERDYYRQQMRQLQQANADRQTPDNTQHTAEGSTP